MHPNPDQEPSMHPLPCHIIFSFVNSPLTPISVPCWNADLTLRKADADNHSCWEFTALLPSSHWLVTLSAPLL